ncbi:receptor-like serine/threonine-protein kinase SD1-7 [Triticum dicoccoides]|uniref:Uncharacterized protein n=1 Tax=Triticum turgidum subsp. durum TaxID=4567 RepID=A0A9R1C5I4_TRITD|nr:receptor-like serine/threonine-protein kinase SD1-7 [Triticum dicoccoides]XP_037463605.1 receptor-like serine/threonine-protein kinase SD1-7 [Triticum dicoccoides]VAI93126.1 unnamed protein product [Triticum turgidum subsp. durum]
MDFKLSVLETITNNFSEDRKVGSGGYGDVYRGMYNGDEIAVKKLHHLVGLDDKAFDSEFRNLSKVQHQNIIRLIGYCYESRHQYVKLNGELVFAKEMERVLCFEFMEGGSLDHHIADDSCGLEWPTCYEIIKGTCEGLNHLHNSQGKPILHLDLKPANILLDKNKTAKIADLGLSRLVASTQTHKTEVVKGSQGYMPPEYIDDNLISMKFDVFSLGVIIIKIMDGNMGRSRCSEMGSEPFIEFVCKKWMTKLRAKSGYSSDEIDRKCMKKCVEIALRCVVADRNKRPLIKDIVKELEELEDEINKMSRSSVQLEELVARQRGCDSNVLAVDPTLELRFLFEPRKDISSCLQLTNMTSGFTAFNVKTNHTKYRTQPSKGVMPPCSKRYISVTLVAQDEAPQNMQCNDMFLVQTACVGANLTSDEMITEDLFKEAMAEKVVDVVKLPIVYVSLDQFQC